MIQSNYPVWRLPRDVRQKLRTAGIKATDLASWAYPITDPGHSHKVVSRAAYTYKAKPRWSKARKARAAFRRKHGVSNLDDVIFNITPIATPFLMSPPSASADPVRPFPDDPASRAPLYLDETGKGASATRAEIDIMDALRDAVKENW